MISRDGLHILCDFPGCEGKVKNHRWGVTKASNWFFSRKSEEAWCPFHLPEWVPAWRAKNERINTDG